jgi:hypothetical protein
MDTTTIFLFFVFFILGYVTRELIGGSKKEKTDSTPDGDTVMRFWIDEQKVQHVELEGQDVSITDGSPEQRKRLSDLLKVLQKWVQYGEPNRPAAEASTGGAVMSALNEDEVPPVVPVVTKEEIKPRIDLVKGAQMFFSENVSRKVEPKPKSIVGMIDDVLQKKLETSPLQSKKIKLEDGPHGEVIVMVGPERYTGVDQVPDPEIQAIIREAIAEWDRTKT